MEVRHETERPLLTKRNENFCKCICISINNIDQKFSFTFGSHYNRNENVLISIMLRSCVRARWKESASTLSVEAADNNGLSSGTNALQVRRKAQDFRRWMRRAFSSIECQLVRECLFFCEGRKSEKELPALAAQPRAFSSLLSLPSQAQSVIKAFRRQGIGLRRCCQYCPLFPLQT